ncbi:MAG: peptidylprolyl isomerase [Mariniblastus sp.]|nr:peptidylprolyl isomerase [Mariniblastus sp.]
MKNKTLFTIAGGIAVLAITSVTTIGCAAQGTATQTSALNQATQGQTQDTPHPALMDPTKATMKSPKKFQVTFETTKGDIKIEVTRAWAPNGADRFYNLCKIGYFNDVAIFRAVKGFMFQFGIHGDPAVSAKWISASIKDDPHIGVPNNPGTVSFAQTGRPNSRGVQMFVNLGANTFLDKPRSGSPFVPFGKIVGGSDVVAKINTEYGENPRDFQGNFQTKGNEYLKKEYPNIDFIKSVKSIKIIEE